MTDDRELTGDEAQRALSEAMRRIRATVPREPDAAELIAFVRGWLESPDMPADTTAIYQHNVRMFTALLTVLEGPAREETRMTLGEAVAHYMADMMAMPDSATDQEQNWIAGHMTEFARRALSSSPASVPVPTDVAALAGGLTDDCDVDEMLAEVRGEASDLRDRLLAEAESLSRAYGSGPVADLLREAAASVATGAGTKGETGACMTSLSDLKAAWESGFKLAVGYGDNHAHFDGEQKERQWRAYLASSAGTAAPVPLPDAAPSPWRSMESARTHGKPFLVSFPASQDTPAMVELVAGWREYEEIIGYGDPPADGWMPVPDPMPLPPSASPPATKGE
jgi:hypothetical protein